jgi:IS605 OrfB family transposase
MSSRSTPGVASIRAGADDRESGDCAAITPIGVDVGMRQLATVASADTDPADAVVVSGDRARDHYAEFTKATHRLQEQPHTTDNLGDIVWRYWRQFRREFRAAADTILTYARQWPAPVVVLEDLPDDRQPLVACRYGQVRAPTWMPTAVQAVIAERVANAGVPVTYVDPTCTTQECHTCGLIGHVEYETLVCTTPDCPVDEVCRDRSAAVTIANRAIDEERA